MRMRARGWSARWAHLTDLGGSRIMLINARPARAAMASPGELLDFEILKECGWMELKLANGAVIRVKVEPSAVVYAGNDPNSGLPIFMVSLGAIVSLSKIPQEMIRRQPPSGAYK